MSTIFYEARELANVVDSLVDFEDQSNMAELIDVLVAFSKNNAEAYYEKYGERFGREHEGVTAKDIYEELLHPTHTYTRPNAMGTLTGMAYNLDAYRTEYWECIQERLMRKLVERHPETKPKSVYTDWTQSDSLVR